MNSYRDSSGLTARANSALLSIEHLINDTSLPSAVRLVGVARIMAEEPVLTDGSTAAYAARSEAEGRLPGYVPGARR